MDHLCTIERTGQPLIAATRSSSSPWILHCIGAGSIGNWTRDRRLLLLEVFTPKSRAPMSSSVLNSELHSTLHDRQRRKQRWIGKDDQLKARRYGMVEIQANGRLKYTYQGKVLIWCPISNRAITSWCISTKEAGDGSGGTHLTDPVLLSKSNEHESDYAQAAHILITNQIRNEKSKWKSHTVLVVDMSGSMRTDDVNGAR